MKIKMTKICHCTIGMSWSKQLWCVWTN